MKKLFDSKFLFIIALSLVVFIILGVGAFYLFDDKDDIFVRNGYVINPLSGKVEKYFFDKDTPYKENLSSMIVFKDIDNKKTSILKDSFLHYNDGSLSFLTNGAILDLDTINGNKAVNFYNITSSSIITKTGDKYVIKTTGNDINLKNFIGRISENKYIVVGKLEAKIPGNEKNISADYFEIVYSEKGIVNIENKDVKFQIAAEGTVIYANGIAIDLGDKKISKNGEDVMSLTAITINGDENIEIIPAPEKETGEEGNGGDGTENNANNQGNGNTDQQQGGEGSTNQQQGGGDGTGQGGTGNENAEINTTQDIVVSLKNASIGSTSVDATFDIYNVKADDTFTLQVTNLESGRTVDVVSSIVADKVIRVNLLSPSTKYLFTVVNDRDGNKYFQKIFETNDFGINLEKTYATDSELGFKVTVDKGTDITNAKLSLYKYNEQTKQNEIVTTSYYDNTANEIKYSEKVTYLSSTNGNIEGTHEIIFDELDSNTIYTAVLDEFSLVSVNFKDVYNITQTAMTLKKAPEFSNMTAVKNIASGTFSLSLKDIIDKDNAIESYTYRIYEVNNPNKMVIDPITKSNASPIEVKIGDKENQLSNDVNYFYKVVIEYYDNEKYVEYILDDTINFVMGSDPYITVVPNDSKISYDRIGATIYLTDNSCLISMPGREKCTGPSSTRINVTTLTSSGIVYVRSQEVDFEVVDDEIKYELELPGLQAGTTYTISVEAVRNDDLNGGTQVLLNTDESKQNITTKTLTNFSVKWTDKGSNDKHVVNVDAKFIPRSGTGTLSPEETASIIKKVELELYNGRHVDDYSTQEPIGTPKTLVNSSEFNIKEKFYDNGYVITSDGDFGLDIDDLKAANGGQLSEYYTVVIRAYYDENNVNEVVLTSNATPYRISPLLLMENVRDPEIHITPRSKSVSGVNSINENLVNSETTVGYLINARWDANGLSSNDLNTVGINLYVYNEKGERVSFYIKNGDDLVRVNGIENASITSATDFYEKEIFMGTGTDYWTDDNKVDENDEYKPLMRRGNNYYIGYQLIVNCSAGNVLYPTNTNENIPNDFGKYSDIIEPQKEIPTTTMYIDKSTSNSITYKYTVKDPDNALFKEENSNGYSYYYVINDGEEVKLDGLAKVENEYNQYAGDLTINGLSKGDTYQLYYKRNISKTNNESVDVSNYYNGPDNGKRIFDGEYNFKTSNYRLDYEVINLKDDNKVFIKISGYDVSNPEEIVDENILENMLDRIVNYEVIFTDTNPLSNPKTIPKNLWKLETCPYDSENANPRCLSVDYAEIKSMKTHEIRVDVIAYYDTGITGYSYRIGQDYDYMIFQNNLVPGVDAKYVTFVGSNTIGAWDSDKTVGKGYYTYTKGSGRNISYTSVLRNKSLPITYSLTGSGYSSDYGILNPKMVSKIKLYCENNDNCDYTGKKFSFHSIIPKIKIDRTVRRIDGAVLTLSLSGADIEDFCVAANENDNCDNSGDVYLYIDVWDEETKAGQMADNVKARPTVQSLKINKENPSASVKAYLDGLPVNKKDNKIESYYYRVYAYLNTDGKTVRKQLYDAGSTDKVYATYSFKSLTSGEIYTKTNVDFARKTDGGYNDKLLTTKVDLIGYTNNEPFNFNLGYAFCEQDVQTCEVDSENNILKNVVDYRDVKTSTVDTIDISNLIKNKKLEFGKKYNMPIVAIYNEYFWNENTHKFETRQTNLQLANEHPSLTKMVLPDFTIERRAIYIPGANSESDKYAIDFTIRVSDSSNVLAGGNYYVALRDAETNAIVGDLQVLNGDDYEPVANGANGAYSDGLCNSENHSCFALDALVIEKHIRISGLEQNKKYTIEVFGETKTFINNYDENVSIDDRHEARASRSHIVYSTNNSGVAFGNELLFSAKAKSFVVTFLGGSNFDNVTRVDYTIGLWDNDEATTYNGGYDIGTGPNQKQFKPFPDTGYWYFEIDGEGIHNVLGRTYTIGLSFDVADGQGPYTFEGKAQYVEENQ